MDRCAFLHDGTQTGPDTNFWKGLPSWQPHISCWVAEFKSSFPYSQSFHGFWRGESTRQENGFFFFYPPWRWFINTEVYAEWKVADNGTAGRTRQSTTQIRSPRGGATGARGKRTGRKPRHGKAATCLLLRRGPTPYCGRCFRGDSNKVSTHLTARRPPLEHRACGDAGTHQGLVFQSDCVSENTKTKTKTETSDSNMILKNKKSHDFRIVRSFFLNKIISAKPSSLCFYTESCSCSVEKRRDWSLISFFN